jgi:hypothetical protein
LYQPGKAIRRTPELGSAVRPPKLDAKYLPTV